MINSGYPEKMSKKEKEKTLKDLKKELASLRTEHAKDQIERYENSSPWIKTFGLKRETPRTGDK